jgi:hypothetical protein
MPASWIVEVIDVFKQGRFRLPACLPYAAPNQLSLRVLKKVSTTALSHGSRARGQATQFPFPPIEILKPYFLSRF